MGVGDALMASGEVRELRKDKPDYKFIIGDGRRSYWNEVFDNNPYIIRGSEINNYKNVLWIDNYEGNRPYRNYGDHLPKNNYNWKNSFKPKKGEIFFTKEEIEFSNLAILNIRKKIGKKKLIFIEPYIKKRLGYQNRDWGKNNWQKVVQSLKDEYEFIHLTYGDNQPLDNCINIHGLNFRYSVAIMSNCDFFLGPEGGMHHAAAATDKNAVVIFGGHISPNITGYDIHTNIYVDINKSPCGEKNICTHCKECMGLISYGTIIKKIKENLN